MATLDIVHLSKRFGSVTAVKDVGFTVNDSEFMCILGPSGCGKSTLLRMIAGFEELSAGDIQIDHESIAALPANKRPTAMVFQKYTLWPHMTVHDNIAFGLGLRQLSREVIERKVKESLALVGLSGYEARYPAQLSGGQQQRVALARAIVLEPKILLLDEPFSSLDAILRVRLREELKRIQRRLKITAIFVTHDQEEALSLADRIAVMSGGEIEQLDHPSTIYSNPQSLFVADFIGAMNLLKGVVQDGTVRVGEKQLAVPSGKVSNGEVTVALRPEDLVLVPDTQIGTVWKAKIDQVMDLGHYRKVLVDVPQLGDLKIFISKAVNLNEGETISLAPTRYLIYQNGNPPVEVNQQAQ
ncbi:MAG: ABC transporter ATP-binding protein [Chloroflexi bacterium]|nr:ABC transporter ATP-binding protein [Chloroflexota bacterium]MCC6896497.1 ABC transporter ATP-binding protein [Anaerolineae bacterium]